VSAVGQKVEALVKRFGRAGAQQFALRMYRKAMGSRVGFWRAVAQALAVEA
jgi:hypothetical protein